MSTGYIITYELCVDFRTRWHLDIAGHVICLHIERFDLCLRFENQKIIIRKITNLQPMADEDDDSSITLEILILYVLN